jgi:hypothetical protein
MAIPTRRYNTSNAAHHDQKKERREPVVEAVLFVLCDLSLYIAPDLVAALRPFFAADFFRDFSCFFAEVFTWVG